MNRAMRAFATSGARTLVVGAAASLGLIAASPADDSTDLMDQDILALSRVGQLRDWLHEPVPVVQALCMQSRLAARWPTDPNATLSDRDRDRFRLASEQCSAATAPEASGDLRLILSARVAMQQQVSRLVGLQSRIRACREQVPQRSTNAEAVPAFRECLAKAMGRPVGEPELRSLLAAAE